jgi:hypothetical protein
LFDIENATITLPTMYIIKGNESLHIDIELWMIEIEGATSLNRKYSQEVDRVSEFDDRVVNIGRYTCRINYSAVTAS